MIGEGSNKEDPIAEVRGAKGGSGKTVCCEHIIERGQVPENLSPSSPSLDSNEIRDVLQQDESGSKLANASGHLPPQSSLWMVEARSVAGSACSSAGESSDKKIDARRRAIDSSDVIEDGDSGPALGEDLSAPGVGLAEPGVLDAGEAEAEVELAVAAEE